MSGSGGRYGGKAGLAGVLAAALAAFCAVAFLAWQGEAGAAPEDNGAAFGSNCGFSHSNNDDPIKHAGHAGMSHPHDFFGNTTTDALSTNASLREGTTVCQRDPENKSAYWVPRLRWEGQELEPVATANAPDGQADIYYKSSFGELDQHRVRHFERNHRMVAYADNDRVGDVTWGCKADGAGEESRLNLDSPPGRCAGDLDVSITFPQCWDERTPAEGVYGMKEIDRETKRCPGSHPYQTPKLTMSVTYELPAEAAVSQGSVRVATGVAADGTTTWGGPNAMHADFMNGWDQAELRHLVEKCINNTPYNLPPGETRPEECQNPFKNG